MKSLKRHIKGFTLIEVVMTLILVGIIAGMAGLWIVKVTEGYIFTKMNADTVQKAQLAMERLTKEFSAIQTVTGSSGGQISYTRTDDALGSVPVTVSVNSDLLQINMNNGGNVTLIDDVNSFSLSYCNDDLNNTLCYSSWTTASKIIQLSLTVSGAENTPLTFMKRITPRNV